MPQRSRFGITWIASLAFALAVSLSCQAASPNIILILADDLGYGELGSYGQTKIATPNLDQMAAQGVRFPQFYAGSPICAPSRSVLLTGTHAGHTRVRGNAGAKKLEAQTLQSTDLTLARVLQDQGYATGLIGKWGLGATSSPGDPKYQGFGYSFGFISQTHAHNHYPDFLIRNGERVALPNDLVPVGEVEGTGYARNGKAYANDLFFEDAERFVTEHREGPFFLFLAITTPHANNERTQALGDGHEVPDEAVEFYADKPWPLSQKKHAAMITRMDAQIGHLLSKLDDLGIDRNTLVLFSSDNGAHREGGPEYAPEDFQASGPLRGIKRDLYEGGIRVPLIARWPGHIPGGMTANHVGHFSDFMATFAELSGAKPPAKTDSISFVPALTGKDTQRAHGHLYWELHEGGFSQAVLMEGRWKALRLAALPQQTLLYDLNTDVGEQTDVARQHPEVVARANRLFESEHVPNEHWKRPAR